MPKIHQLYFLFLLPIFTSSQSSSTNIIKQYNQQHAQQMLAEYKQFLSIPNLVADPVSLQMNASFIMSMMQQRGIDKIQLLKASTTGVPPAVYGEILVPNATQTLVFYAHYDGQPVNPAQWAKGLEPFQPKLFTKAFDKGGEAIDFPANNTYDSDWRIYARGASDDKAGVAAILNAFKAIKNCGIKLKSNIKFLFEGEEEAGSTHLDEILENNKSLLQSDLWIICDGPVHQSGKKQIVFGARGDAHLDLTVYASKRPLHSGHYGNWAPNPAMMLAKLLASMKDENGLVTVKDFYADVTPLTALEQQALNEVPSADEQMKEELGIRNNEMKGKNLSASINLPSLNINGMQSGNTGKMASNQIPTTATAVIDLRLVLGNDWKRQQQKVIDHIKLQGYFVVDHEPTDNERKIYEKLVKIVPDTGMNAQRTSMNLPIIRKIIVAVKTTTKEQVVLQPTMGGTLPLFLFEQILHAKTITVPIANHDNNQHAENENICLANFFEGIETMSALMLIK